MSTNCDGRQFFSVFHGPSTLKLFSPALQHDMILSYTKENARKTCKNVEKMKKHASKFLVLSIDDMKTEKRKKENSNIYTTGQKACNSVKKRLQHKCFSVKFPKFLKTPFLIQHLQWLLLTYRKSFLVLFTISFVWKQKIRAWSKKIIVS